MILSEIMCLFSFFFAILRIIIIFAVELYD